MEISNLQLHLDIAVLILGDTRGGTDICFAGFIQGEGSRGGRGGSGGLQLASAYHVHVELLHHLAAAYPVRVELLHHLAAAYRVC